MVFHKGCQQRHCGASSSSPCCSRLVWTASLQWQVHLRQSKVIFQWIKQVETLITAMYDEFPWLRARQWLVVGGTCFAGFLLGLPMCLQVDYFLVSIEHWNTGRLLHICFDGLVQWILVAHLPGSSGGDSCGLGKFYNMNGQIISYEQGEVLFQMQNIQFLWNIRPCLHEKDASVLPGVWGPALTSGHTPHGN